MNDNDNQNHFFLSLFFRFSIFDEFPEVLVFFEGPKRFFVIIFNRKWSIYLDSVRSSRQFGFSR